MSGSAIFIWFACCCSFVAFTGIVATAVIIYGRKADERRRALRARKAAEAHAGPDEPSSSDQGTSL